MVDPGPWPSASLSNRPTRAGHSDSGSDDSTPSSRNGSSLPRQSSTADMECRALPENSSQDDSETASVTLSTLMDRVPDLTRGSSIASSTASGSQVDVVDAMQNGCTREVNDIASTQPRREEHEADLLCPFQILGCDLIFSCIRSFKTHVFSHFHGRPLPTTAKCFLCEANFDQTPEDDPALAWNNMLGHMAHEHFRCGQEVGTIRADFSLMRWMYDRKIISDEYFKRSQICPAATILPTAIHRRLSIISNGAGIPPEVPSPPSLSAPSSISTEISISTRRLSVYGSRPSVIFAGVRAERRRRESIRPTVRHVSMVS